MRKLCDKTLVVVILPWLILPASIRAAESGTGEPPGDNLVLEKILVTASRRVESLQDVPISVSAFSSDFLQDTGVNQLNELQQYTPNFRVSESTDSRSTTIRIRGIGSVGSNSGVDPSVGKSPPRTVNSMRKSPPTMNWGGKHHS